MNLLFLAVLAAGLGLGVAVLFANKVLSHDEGSEKMVQISQAIQEGALAFLTREYRSIAIVVVVVAVLMLFWLGQPLTAVTYVLGAIFSGTAGFVGLWISTRANARTTNAAKKGLSEALMVAFRGGGVMGMTVAGLGLLGVSACFIFFFFFLGLEQAGSVFSIGSVSVTAKNVFEDIIPGFGLGASTIALFARVGGGIFTKAADVGADLVGKVEAGIPEDDPRNPAVIADNVGDNVGDVAGMGADLYESYIGSIIAPLALGSILLGFNGAVLSVMIAAVGIICSIAASFFVRSSPGGHPGRALSIGTYGAAVLTTIGCYILVMLILGNDAQVTNPVGFFFAIVAGLAAGMGIGQVSEIFTSERFKSVRELAESSKTGAATNILAGVADGMRSTASSIIILVVALFIAYSAGEWAMAGGGVYAIGLSAIGMLATTGIVVSVDAYGPIADNAGGIAEMSEQEPGVREITDALDSAGNTTAAIAKGFAVASAAVTGLALFNLYSAKVGLTKIDILEPQTLIGLFLGGMFPFLFSSLAIRAVGNAAFKMVEEVRRQFREIAGLKEGKRGAKADYATCVDISTKAALREMIAPATIAVVSPVLIGLWDPQALGGYLAGALVVGFLMAIFMANAGGAWDNAKKFIEAGNLGGKGSDPHKAAVVGDTVGDPFKDTAGPSMNIMIKVMSVVAVIFAPLFIG
ncbi:MAG: sodium-translocating pyrophosphatase [Terriglobia bacterium]